MISPQRRSEIIGALRRGTVPQAGLDVLAVGLERFQGALDAELAEVKTGRGGFKVIRGEYGSGKTFFARWLEERARSSGFASSEVQISETETPLHRMETIYRRVIERLATADSGAGAFRAVIDGWFYALEQDVLAQKDLDERDEKALLERTNALLEQRLVSVSRAAPAFSVALRAYRHAAAEGARELADGLIAWLAGQPNVGANVKRAAGLKGDVDHFGAANFLAGLLAILRDSGFAGLVLTLDEVETLQRMRTDTRERGLNALRQWLDEIDAGRFAGLYLVVTGTPAFLEGPQGIQRLPPLAQRLQVDFSTDARFDNARAVQIRLPGFDLDLLARVGCKVRDIYADGAAHREHLLSVVDDAYVGNLAASVTGRLGGKVGVAPRLFLKKLVADVLDRVDQYPDFEPRRHYALTLSEKEMTSIERAAAPARGPDDIELTP